MSVRSSAVLGLALAARLALTASPAEAGPPQTQLVSRAASGATGGNGESRAMGISADGRFVLFQSLASDLVAKDGNGEADVFVRDLASGTTALVSVSRSGRNTGKGPSGAIAITPNGRFVLFHSEARNLAAGDKNSGRDVFVRDLKRGTTALVSVERDGTGTGNHGSAAAAMTPNGRFVAFSSFASDLVPDDGNGDYDAFVRDLKLGTTTLVSVDRTGAKSANAASSPVAITPNGRFVVFESQATDLVDAVDAPFTSDLFLRDLKNGTTTLLSASPTGEAAAAPVRARRPFAAPAREASSRRGAAPGAARAAGGCAARAGR